MSREVIQDFLNLAGVVGIALTNRRMRPYFYGLDSVLDRTKQALGQGVLQVVENVPEGFESFEFHFTGHVVFIYKLTHGLVLLVLTDSALELVDYRRGITKIKYLIETDTYNTVAYFKLLLGSVTQHSLPSSDWNANNAKTTAPVTEQAQSRSFTSPVANPQPEKFANFSSNSAPDPRNASRQQNTISNSTLSTNAQSTNAQAQANVNQANVTKPSATKPQTPPTPSVSLPNNAPATNNHTKATDNHTKQVSAKTDTQEYKLDELLSALNKLSHFTTQYLGKVVVTNYWKSSRPDSTWLKEFEVDRNGQISHPKQNAIACTPEQIAQIQEWVQAYIKRCKQVIRNFDQMLEQDCLDSRQKAILL